MPVRIANQEISALIDTGSSINVMSSQLFNSIPDSMKSEFSATSDKITLANNQTVQIYGTAKVKITVPQGKHWIHVYILAQTSHPLILGTHYLYSKNIVLDFSDCCIKSKQFKVLTQSPASLPPNSEVLIWGHVNGKVQYGMQGICTSKISKDRGVIISKAVVTVNREKQVPIKILNFTNEIVHLNKGQILAELEPFSKDHVCMPLSENNDTHFVQNIQLSTEPVIKDTEIDSKFISYFNIPEYLTEVQKSTLIEFLHSNKELFVTEENPDLGFTNVVQHQICLKPDFKPKHQRSYRLTPEKKDILRHHLDELLRQGVIAPVDETEDVPITSPVVLVSKRTYQKGKANASSKETSLSKFRFCCDFRYLNSMTQHFSYSIPDLQDLTESFSTKTPNFLTSIDLSSGFFQLPISKDSQRYTAFNTCFGTFKFLRLPMGLSSSPASFQLLMDKVLKGLTFKSCLCYLDDILIASETFDQHIEDLRNVFQRLSNAGLKLGPKKCTFAQNSCIYLGHKISNKGIEPPPDRVQAIVDYPIPKNVKELRRLVGLFNWFRKYIKNFSAEMEPLTRLLKKYERFSWTDEQQRAFQNVKSLLLDSPILAFPNFNLPFRLAVDSCCKGIGYVLYQKMSETDEIRVIRFGSKALSKWQKSYGPTKLELLGMVTAVLECSSYLRTQPFVIECDHQALKPLFSNQLKGAIYERWIAILQQYNFEIQYKPAREMQVPDALSRCTQETNNAFESPDEQDPYFPYEPENTGQIIVPGGIQLTTLLHDSDTSDSKNLQLNNICLPAPVPMYTVDNSVPRKNVLLQAQNEYDADTEDIDQQFARVAKKRKPRKTIQLYPRKKYNVVKKSEPLNKLTDCDSKHTQISISDQLNQFEKVYQQITQSTNLPKSDQIFDQSTDSATSQCDATFFNQSTESSQNEEPDKIFNQSTASDNVQDSDKIFEQTTDVNETQVAYTSENEITNNYTNKRDSDTGIDSDPNVNILKSIDIFREKGFSIESIHELQRNDTNCRPLIKYLERNELPKLQKEARRLLLLIPNFHLINGILFHTRNRKSVRAKTMNNFQLVVPEISLKTIIALHHDSTLGGHCGIQNTLDLIQEQYYFPNLSEKVTDYIRSCHECQSRKNTTLKTKASITSFPTPCAPFEVWEMDLQYGPVPVSRSGNSYIFTAIDLFSKYMFAEPIPNTDPLTVGNALFRLVTQFGVCRTIVSDQGSEFIGKCFREVCRLLDIIQEYTPSFAHHCLGACERPHRTLSERLTPFIVKGKPWEDVLPGIVFSMNNTPNQSVGFSPFEIVFGKRPQFPLSLHIKDTDFSSVPKDCHTYLKQQCEKLNIIRTEVEKNAINSKVKMMDRVNKDKISNISFNENDYVYLLKEPTGSGQKFKNKFAGPYVISAVNSPHMYTLKDPHTNKILSKSVHINRLKSAYVRKPNPSKYFMDPVHTKLDDVEVQDYTSMDEDNTPVKDNQNTNYDNLSENTSDSDNTSKSDNILIVENSTAMSRPKRTKKLPARFKDNNFIHFSEVDVSSESTSASQLKVKRFLAHKIMNGKRAYLAHIVGEPAQHAMWLQEHQLGPKAKAKLKSRPPPKI